MCSIDSAPPELKENAMSCWLLVEQVQANHARNPANNHGENGDSASGNKEVTYGESNCGKVGVVEEVSMAMRWLDLAWATTGGEIWCLLLFASSSSSRHAPRVYAATSSPPPLCQICLALPLTNQPKQGRIAHGQSGRRDPRSNCEEAIDSYGRGRGGASAVEEHGGGA
ncbi:hypothetical protein OsI_16875 [Oryza sativa Indica Group]|uniref:Uncharacterized protein n=1 Tax=Oryza sativa subsp. indica TaxID=39946 RepID=B8ASP6_ORYSI|nr:hypothetical protein OsI_16875 [Oryza sativa Indica Group]